MNDNEDNAIGDLLEKLNGCIRNAHHWLRSAPNQSEGAILEARGICLHLAEKHYKTNLSVKPSDN